MFADSKDTFYKVFFYRYFMNIYVYSDESGVFDKKHNDFYVFGGLIIIDNESKMEWSNKYAVAENVVKSNYPGGTELKACIVSNKDKGKLFRSLNNCHKFGVVIDQRKVHDKIFDEKKTKQRYLDYAYKIAIKRAFENLIHRGVIDQNENINIYFYVDEHTTATNGRYELRESLEQEFKYGTFTHNFMSYFPPIFSNLRSVEIQYCDSKKKTLIRASDIIANNIYYHAVSNKMAELYNVKNLNIAYLP